MVSVEPPETTRRCRKSCAPARASARKSTPRCCSKRSSSYAFRRRCGSTSAVSIGSRRPFTVARPEETAVAVGTTAEWSAAAARSSGPRPRRGARASAMTAAPRQPIASARAATGLAGSRAKPPPLSRRPSRRAGARTVPKAVRQALRRVHVLHESRRMDVSARHRHDVRHGEDSRPGDPGSKAATNRSSRYSACAGVYGLEPGREAIVPLSTSLGFVDLEPRRQMVDEEEATVAARRVRDFQHGREALVLAHLLEVRGRRRA